MATGAEGVMAVDAEGEAVKDPLALESQVCFALSLASRSVIAAYRPALEPLHLTHPQYLVMLALWERAPLSVKGLSGLLHLEPATLSPLIKRLEALGYVLRTRDSADERSLAIVLTDEGAALRAEAEKIPAAMMRRLRMDEQELTALHASMMKLITVALEDEVPGG
ncbi:MarR family transcriptional regulator [Brachybacterium rhamnosum]|uniref:MarR family winged helix-turn-helix transcriptional regulator n=1 Tax=Brachybacterium rhamnosum TaxID=173361 RepID=A0ABW4PZB6_9MICO